MLKNDHNSVEATIQTSTPFIQVVWNDSVISQEKKYLLFYTMSMVNMIAMHKGRASGNKNS